ncbi:MAG: flagellar biosynthesis protein FlhB [Pseudomonadota bacterium]|jgi:flagellar biosynthetic protein FlhB
MAEDPESQTEEPTDRKLGQAKEKGDVVKSADIPQVATLAAITATVAWLGSWMMQSIANSMLPFLAHPDQIDLSGHGTVDVMQRVSMAMLPVLGTIFAVTVISGVAGNVFQTGLMFTPSKLFEGGLNKLNPLEGFKRLFGVDALIQFTKSLIKVVILAIIAWWILKPHAMQITQLAELAPAAIIPLTWDILKGLLYAVLIMLAFGAGIDWFIQRQRFMKRMRMSKQEVKDENKQSEGDPQIKARLRQIRMQRARRRMMSDVAKATVVVMNPTHYAVALRYDPGVTAVPMCVAKGMDLMALKIREIAEEAGVPVIEDPPLARALFATVEIDETIPKEQYEAVAKVIGFIMGKKQARSRARSAPR